MITDYFWHKIEDIDKDDMWFQFDGATFHFPRVTFDVLYEIFRRHIISHHCEVEWPVRPCDLMIYIFF